MSLLNKLIVVMAKLLFPVTTGLPTVIFSAVVVCLLA